MSDSAPPKATQADAKQAGAKQAKAAQADTTEAEETRPEQAEDSQTGAGQADGTGSEGADGKPDMDEVKRKFREALDKKHEAQAQESATGGRNTGKIHGAHGSEDHRRTFRRKSG